MQLDSWKV